MRFRRTVWGLALPLALMSASGWSQVTPGQGKLLLTGGVSTIDGAAGGGLTPWAVTGTHATAGEIGATAFVSRALTQDFALNVYGVAVSALDRVELSLARQDFNTRSNLAPLNPALAGLRVKQNIVGVKVRVAGDAVLDSDRWMPQVAVGLMHKRVDSGALESTLEALGAKTSGTDLYVSATKLFLAPGILLNGTLRATKANQNGLLGFGGTDHTSYRVQPEVSAAWLVNKHVAIGAEYRAKPDNLNFPTPNGNGLKEDDWFDVFIAWAPSKHLSFTLAYVDLGHIAPALVPDRQTGTYLSVQVGF
ncbi:MAG: hypothetical protein RLZZ618_2977 [Pseudomonadota bacterium]|jgi:hypothetical protein